MQPKPTSWVLVTDGSPGQARSTLAATRSLGEAGYGVAVTVTGPNSLAASSRWCRRVVETPDVDHPGYASAVREETAVHPYDLVLPASDAALIALGSPGQELVDKENMERSARRAGIPTPETLSFESFESLKASAQDLPYPVVIKPSVKESAGERGLSARRFESVDELVGCHFSQGLLLAQPFIRAPIRAVAGIVWEGRMVASVTQAYLRTWPPDCGTACAAVSVRPDLQLEEKLNEMLSGYSGIFQAQFAGRYLIDLNPRIYGSLPLAVKAGANLPAMLAELASGRDVAVTRARTGVHYRWIEGDIRHWLRQGRHHGTLLAGALSFRPHRASAHSDWSIRDPAPSLARIRHVARRLRRRAS